LKYTYIYIDENKNWCINKSILYRVNIKMAFNLILLIISVDYNSFLS